MTRSRGASGVSLVSALPWVIAALSLAVAAGSALRSSSPPPAARPPASGDSTETKTLRLALATAKSENAALRQELDRLVMSAGSGRAKGALPGFAPAASGTPAEAPTPSAQLRETAEQVKEALSRAAAGDQASARDAAMGLMKLLQGGPGAIGALKEAYLSTADPKARMMMLPTMLFGGGAEARDFVIHQAQTETDPELHRALLVQAATFATPQNADTLKDTFLGTLSSSDGDASTRAAAIRGLRYAQGQDVQEALLAAASDPSEEIRLAAIENLASRPALRDSLRDAVSRDPSGRVREIGQCRLLLAENGG